VLANQLGRKSKLGIYDYSSDPPAANPNLRPRPDDERLGA
jgi:hypothetical protein